MKIEIDIDISRIDYDSINAQIKEKLEGLTPTDIFSRYYKTDADISEYIEKYLKDGSFNYIVNKGWWSNNSEAERKISDIAKEIITTKVIEVCDGILETMPEKDLQELVYKILPNVFVDALYGKIMSSLYSGESHLRCDVHQMCRGIVDDAFRARSGY
jgi:hypothetical protein